jgi:hypothetical protein
MLRERWYSMRRPWVCATGKVLYGVDAVRNSRTYVLHQITLRINNRSWSACEMVHGLAISLPESALVQSPLRLSACAHTHIHTRTRAGSDARLAAARGSGRYSRCISTAAGHIVERLPHGSLVQTRISKCGGSSDDIALTSPTRGWLSDGACVLLLRRVPSQLATHIPIRWTRHPNAGDQRKWVISERRGAFACCKARFAVEDRVLEDSAPICALAVLS